MPRVAATAVLRALGVSSSADLRLLEDIAWERGVHVRDRPMSGAEARLVVYGDRGIITVAQGIDPTRRRFSIAHELGHFEMHKNESALAGCLSDDIERPPRWSGDPASRREAEANEFASHLLLSDEFVTPLVRGKPATLDVIQTIASEFGVSLRAAAIAFIRLCRESCAVVYSQDGHVRWCVRSKDLEEERLWIPPGPLDRFTLAADFFRGREIQQRPGRVDAISWFERGSFREDATIKEHSMALPRYNGVLSLLWVDQEIR